MAKMIVYGEDARKKLQSGIDQLSFTLPLKLPISIPQETVGVV